MDGWLGTWLLKTVKSSMWAHKHKQCLQVGWLLAPCRAAAYDSAAIDTEGTLPLWHRKPHIGPRRLLQRVASWWLENHRQMLLTVPMDLRIEANATHHMKNKTPLFLQTTSEKMTRVKHFHKVLSKMNTLVELEFSKQIFKRKQSTLNLVQSVCSVLLLSKSELFYFAYNDTFGEAEIISYLSM